MDTQERELRRDSVGRTVRAALVGERAPEAWLHAALAVPARAVASARATAPLPMLREESRLLVILPHLLGVVLLLGFGLSALLRPDLMAALDALLKPLFAGASFGTKDAGADLARLTPWLMVCAPLIAVLAIEATRGFAFVRRWFS